MLPFGMNKNNDIRDALYESNLSNEMRTRGVSWWKQLFAMFLYGFLNGILKK